MPSWKYQNKQINHPHITLQDFKETLLSEHIKRWVVNNVNFIMESAIKLGFYSNVSQIVNIMHIVDTFQNPLST